MKIRRIYLDMDDVLADFVGGVCRFWNVDRKEVESCWTKGVWDVVPPLSQVLKLKEIMPETTFWSRLDRNEQFWTGLDLKSHSIQLLQLVAETVGDNWNVLTAPSYCPTCYTGKIRWLREVIGQTPHKMIPTPYKYLLAKPGMVLIDDRESNVLEFRAEGGEAILYPTHHNSAHAHAERPIDYIESELRILEA